MQKIDGLIFVKERKIPYQNYKRLGDCQRSLRANTPQGPRVALAHSEILKNAYDEVIAIFYEDEKNGLIESALHSEGRRFRSRAEAEIEAKEFLRSRGFVNE